MDYLNVSVPATVNIGQSFTVSCDYDVTDAANQYDKNYFYVYIAPRNLSSKESQKTANASGSYSASFSYQTPGTYDITVVVWGLYDKTTTIQKNLAQKNVTITVKNRTPNVPYYHC